MQFKRERYLNKLIQRMNNGQIKVVTRIRSSWPSRARPMQSRGSMMPESSTSGCTISCWTRNL